MTIKKILLLLKKFDLPTLFWDHNVFLFNCSDALKFMDFCDENKINILGMDGFRIEKNKRQPDLKYIYDGGTTSVNRKFLQKDIQNNYDEIKNIYFEFVLEEDEI